MTADAWKVRRFTFALGATQLVSWAVSFYMPAVIAEPAAAELGMSRGSLLAAFSWALIAAGCCAPHIGRWIGRHGGRAPLAAGALAMALGLGLLAAAHGPLLWYAGWTIVGIGMALGLYDAVFATLGGILGKGAAPAITGVTLMGGFASSIGWPVGAYLTATIGWRGTLIVYAAAELVVNLPIVLMMVPRPTIVADRTAQRAAATVGPRRGMLACLMGFFTLRWFVTSALAVAILPLLGGMGLSPGEAVAASALIGPGQVAGRLLEWSSGGRFGLIGRAALGASLAPIGIIVLIWGSPIAGPAVAACLFAVLYGMSNGIMTINRGTLPLAIFGAEGYAALIGWLAVPVLLAQAAAPTLTAPFVTRIPSADVFGAAGVLATVALILLLPLRPRAATAAAE
ncbi:MFS transporter [Aliidongia dinghuensis]|uniref:MFS transporter n=1 Tax=Aliidongia dinghuensis TaxID=1867774 RepID=A0A8J2YSX3_9PROT|nr:MFS transporter [Aliidongia dinghuensis]GGF17332.1 MFS transporter [Aliidongia dinghuensis]